jgi:hypothetical protein
MSQFKKFPKIFRLGSEDVRDFMTYGNDQIIIEEKVDGGNGSFWIDEDEAIHVASRNRDLTSEEDEKTFAKQRATLKEILKDKQELISKDYIYYIEWMAKHTISYTKAPDIIGLDIRSKRSMVDGQHGLFLSRTAKEVEFEKLGIEVVPLVGVKTINEIFKEDVFAMIPQSKYYDGKAEGVVLKNYARKSTNGNYQLFAKVVAIEFKEKNKTVFGNVKDKITDTDKVVNEYCTDGRIKKMIGKLINEEGHKLEMNLMKYLPSAVAKDILAEEITGIYEAYKWLDFKSFKGLVTKRCVIVLQKHMVEM